MRRDPVPSWRLLLPLPLLLPILRVSPLAALPVTQLFPHGKLVGDQLLKEGDDESAELSLTQPLHFFEAQFSKLYVSTNGIISTQVLPKEDQYLDQDFPTDFPSMAPFLADLDTSGGSGQVMYREDKTPAVLVLAANFVHIGFPETASQFTPNHSFLVTWKQVGAYQKDRTPETPSKEVNTFQAVMVSNKTDTYALFLYPTDGLQFFETHPKKLNRSKLMLPARVGFCRGHLKDQMEGPFFRFSYAEGILKNLSRHSNLGVPGVWGFHIGSNSPLKNVKPAVFSEIVSRTNPSAHHEHSFNQEDSLQNVNAKENAIYYYGNKELVDRSFHPETLKTSQGHTHKESCKNNQKKCSQNAYCKNYATGFCCHCHTKFFGNGMHCLPEGAANRASGKVSGHLIVGNKSMNFSNLDMHSYMVGNDGRAYTSLSSSTLTIAWAFLPLIPIGGLFGWLFALEKPGWENGFRLTGSTFNQNINITFYPGGESVQIIQKTDGFDPDLNMYVTTYMKGHLPYVAENSTVKIEPYKEIYNYSDSIVTSTSFRNYTVTSGDVTEKKSYLVNQTITYEKCRHSLSHEPLHSTQMLTVDRVFVSYRKGENMLTYAVNSQIGPAEDEHDETTMNPCFRGTHNCDINAQCYPESGVQYTCQCKHGYHGTGLTCVDINECSYDLHICGPHSICINLIGSYLCDCIKGYRLGEDLRSCHLIEHVTNPCEDGSHTCAPADQAECIFDGERSFTCVCHPGYTGNGHQCTAIEQASNPCEDGSHNCAPADQADCIYNGKRSFTCVCRPGYTGNGHQCTAIEHATNPCEDGSHNCAPADQADCIYDGKRSFTCVCHSGYTGNGHQCTDIDECSEYKCHMYATCYNTPGSFSCYCQSGYTGDGFHCTEETKPCEKQFRDALAQSTNPQKRIHIPQCDEKGDFMPLQCHATTGFCWCVETDGKEVPDTQTPPGSNPPQCGPPEVDYRPPTVCQRWREQLLEIYEGQPKDDQYLPHCDDQGEFTPMQCQGKSDFCWCVNKEGKEVSRPHVSPQGTLQCTTTTSDEALVQPTTHPKIKRPFLLYAQGTQIGYVSLNCSHFQKDKHKPLLSLQGSIAVGIDYDCKDEMVYWTDVSARTISRAKLEPGAEREIIIDTELISPEGLAIDIYHRRMYYTDSVLDKIESSKLDGTAREVLFNQNLVNPRAITLDPDRGNLYWTDWNREGPKIEMSTLNGRDRKILVNQHLALPNALTFDRVNKQLCWADAGTNTLECVQPNGSGRKLIYSNLNHPFSIVSYEDHFYLTDWRRDGIIAINRTSGQFTEEYLPEQRTHLYEIALVQSSCPVAK